MAAPEEIAAGLLQLRDTCEKYLSKKDETLSELYDQIRERDNQYVAAIRQQRGEIDDFFARMRRSVRDIQTKYDEELVRIEEAFVESRNAVIQAQNTEIDALVDERRKTEAKLLEDRIACVNDFEQRLEMERLQAIDRYNKERIRLEREAAAREQQMEKIRAIYQLNTQKLKYNYSMLTERDMEANHTIGLQKKKISRLQDSLSTVISRHTKAEAKHRAVNRELTLAYRRVTAQYHDLQSKFKHFEKSEGATYRRLWAHHEQEVSERLSGVIQADEIISRSLLNSEAAYKKPQVEVASEEKAASELEEKRDEESILAGCRVGAEEAVAILENLSAAVPLLSRESLLSLIAGEEEQEPIPVPVRRILATLSIDNSKDLDALIDAVTVSQGDHTLLPVKRLIQELRTYIAAKKDSGPSFMGNAEDESTAKTDAVDMKFWKHISETLPEFRVRTWKLLEKSLTKYNDILRERVRLVDENDSLVAQNHELRQLLAQYLKGPLNEQLLHPPRLASPEDVGSDFHQVS